MHVLVGTVDRSACSLIHLSIVVDDRDRSSCIFCFDDTFTQPRLSLACEMLSQELRSWCSRPWPEDGAVPCAFRICGFAAGVLLRRRSLGYICSVVYVNV